jgi:A/G-specific adenine glycosylase
LPGDWIDLGAVSHGFTHFELLLRVRALRLAARPPLAGNWLSVDEMASAGLPTLFQKAVTLVMAHESGSEDQ